MTRNDLIEALAVLAEGAGKEEDLMPAAVVIHSLCAALSVGVESELMAPSVALSRRIVEAVTGEPDWSDDTLKV